MVLSIQQYSAKAMPLLSPLCFYGGDVWIMFPPRNREHEHPEAITDRNSSLGSFFFSSFFWFPHILDRYSRCLFRPFHCRKQKRQPC